MAPPPEKNRDGSKGRGGSKRKSKSKQKTKTREKAQQKQTTPTQGFQRIGEAGGLKTVPSNAPTMAIAPSDYEHIFHEGAGGAHSPTPAHNGAVSPQAHQQAAPTSPVPPYPAALGPGMGATGPKPMGFVAGGASIKPHFAGGTSPQNYGRPVYEQQPSPPLVTQQQMVTPSPPTFEIPLQVTADGYTLLGQVPDESGRHIPLPPHVVRASNQFSRAALARIANYLASRAER